MMSHEVITHEVTTEVMEYSQKNLTPDESKEIFRKLGNSQVSKLCFLGNNATSGAIPVLVDAIEKNPHLLEIYLGDNNIGDEGANILSTCLQHNKTIKLLDINSNNITDSGAAAIAKALKVNTTLTELDLTYNEIGDGGFQEILNALEKNKESALISFSLFQNIAKDATLIQRIDKRCESNKTRLNK